MASDARTHTAPLEALSLRRVATAPLRPQTYKNLVYLWLAFPLGLAYFVSVVVGFSVSAGLVVVLVGIPMLLLALVCVVLAAWFERKLTTVLLSVDIPDPGFPFLEREGLREQIAGLVLGVDTWKAVVYLLSKFVIGLASFVLLVTLLSTSLALIGVPLLYNREGIRVGLVTEGPIELAPSIGIPWDGMFVGVEAVIRITSWQVDTVVGAAILSLFGVVLLVVSLNVFNAVAWVVGRYARVMLGPSGQGLEERIPV